MKRILSFILLLMLLLSCSSSDEEKFCWVFYTDTVTTNIETGEGTNSIEEFSECDLTEDQATKKRIHLEKDYIQDGFHISVIAGYYKIK